jgi:hypothetical protein
MRKSRATANIVITSGIAYFTGLTFLPAEPRVSEKFTVADKSA